MNSISKYLLSTLQIRNWRTNDKCSLWYQGMYVIIVYVGNSKIFVAQRKFKEQYFGFAFQIHLI